MSDSQASRAAGALGVSLPREDGREKIHGQARYADDLHPPGLLFAAVLRSPHAHARIRSLDLSRASGLPGVRGVFSGRDFPNLIGIYLGDKSVLATEKVRHYGEGVAAVVADSEAAALEALGSIKVEYEPLPLIGGPREALAEKAALVHEHMESYFHIPAILPEPGTNVANRTRIRKGDAAAENWFHRRRERGTANDYPLVTACFLVRQGRIGMALSGVLSYPFRDEDLDRLLNDTSLAPEARAEAVLEEIGAGLREDFRASAAYRRHLLGGILVDALSELGGAS